MITNLSTVGVTVSNQDKALDFYVNKLGFEKRMDAPMSADERWLQVGPPGSETCLQLGLPHDFPGERMGTFVNIIMQTPDLSATYHQLKERGVHFTVEPKLEPWGHWAQFVDLDGNEFGLIQLPEKHG